MGENFEALYQQNPVAKGGNLFKTEWIRYISREAVDSIIFEKRFITVDSALKDKEKNDYTVYSSFGVFEKRNCIKILNSTILLNMLLNSDACLVYIM